MYFPSVPPRARKVKRARVQSGDSLGALPLLAAAASSPTVRGAISKAVGGLIGIVDPGKKREANRKARAQMWGDIARQGSITAARYILGGRTMVYTVNEKGYYEEQWKQLQAAQPGLASRAQSLGGLGPPGNGDDPPSIDEYTQQALQKEVDEFRNPGGVSPAATTGTGTTAPVVKQAGFGGWLIPGLALSFIASRIFKK